MWFAGWFGELLRMSFLKSITVLISVTSAVSQSPPLWCGGTPTVPTEAQWWGEVATRVFGEPTRNYFAVGEAGVYQRGKGILGLEEVAMLSAVCLSNATMNAVNKTATPRVGASFTLALRSPHAATATAAGCVLITLSPTDNTGTWPPNSTVDVDYYVSDPEPGRPCPSDPPQGKPTYDYNSVTFHSVNTPTRVNTIVKCDAMGGTVPPALIGPLAR